jgi:hypothetical protein
LLDDDAAEGLESSAPVFDGQSQPKLVQRNACRPLGPARGGTGSSLGCCMVILRAASSADARRATGLDPAAPVTRLWADRRRIDERRFRGDCAWLFWNSEVGKASVGISTFWFQSVCQNHLVWDATEVVEFTRKHTGKVHESLGEIRRIVEGLVTKRDSRRDGFAALMRKAMATTLGTDADEVEKLLAKSGFNRALAARAVALAQETKSRFSVFSVVDALTRMARELPNASDRTAADEKASKLLALAA